MGSRDTQAHKSPAEDPSFSSLRQQTVGSRAHVGTGQNPINHYAPPGSLLIRFVLVRNPLERLASLRRHCLDHKAHRLNKT